MPGALTVICSVLYIRFSDVDSCFHMYNHRCIGYSNVNLYILFYFLHSMITDSFVSSVITCGITDLVVTFYVLLLDYRVLTLLFVFP